ARRIVDHLVDTELGQCATVTRVDVGHKITPTILRSSNTARFTERACHSRFGNLKLGCTSTLSFGKVPVIEGSIPVLRCSESCGGHKGRRPKFLAQRSSFRSR